MAAKHQAEQNCIDDRTFLNADTDVGVEEETSAEVHEQTVECPDCHRQYTLVFLFDGVREADSGEYVTPPERFEEVNGAQYYGDERFNVPIQTDDGDPYELVYVLDRIENDAGETVIEL